MSKIYLKETGKEVKIGSKTSINGVRVSLTKTFIKDNPELFYEKTTPLFTSEDGVDIYECDDYYFVHIGDYNGDKPKVKHMKPYWVVRDTKNFGKVVIDLNNTNVKRFAHKSNAEAWIRENKPKTLKDYEARLLTATTPLYVEMKAKEPKLFYYKVLTLIQQDLGGSGIYYITSEKEPGWCVIPSVGLTDITFITEKAAKKAIEIMGDKLDLFL